VNEQPEGRGEAEAIELGEPVRDSDDAERAPREEDRPDLDERQRGIGEGRRPMGPPLNEPQERGEEREQPASTEGPTDPE
jgi:hypothetical protein